MKLSHKGLFAVLVLVFLFAACGPSEQELANARIANAAADAITQSAAQQNRLLNDLRDERVASQDAIDDLRAENTQLVDKMTEQQKQLQAQNAELVEQMAGQQKELQAHTLKTGEQMLAQQQSFWASVETLLTRQGALEDKLLGLTERQGALLVALTFAFSALSVVLGVTVLAALFLVLRRQFQHRAPMYLPDARGYAFLPDGRVEIIAPRDDVMLIPYHKQ